jgi:hypothetical protein
MGGQDEREQTLNQLLTEMDGLLRKSCLATSPPERRTSWSVRPRLPVVWCVS